MRITESKLRRIIRSVIAEDLNEGIISDFIDNKFGDANYRALRRNCKSIIKNIEKDDRFESVNLELDPNTSGLIKGFVEISSFESDDIYTFEVLSDLDHNNDYKLTISFKTEDFAGLEFKVDLKLGNYDRVLNHVKSYELVHISTTILQQYYDAFYDKLKQADRDRSMQARIERERAKADRAKKLGISRKPRI